MSDLKNIHVGSVVIAMVNSIWAVVVVKDFYRQSDGVVASISGTRGWSIRYKKWTKTGHWLDPKRHTILAVFDSEEEAQPSIDILQDAYDVMLEERRNAKRKFAVALRLISR